MNGNEGIFAIEGLTTYPKLKTKTYCVMGSSKQLSELKTELSLWKYGGICWLNPLQIQVQVLEVIAIYRPLVRRPRLTLVTTITSKPIYCVVCLRIIFHIVLQLFQNIRNKPVITMVLILLYHVQGHLGYVKTQHSLRFSGYSYPLKSIQMTHLHFGVCLLFSSACDRWLQDATTGHGAPLEEGSAENLVFKADRKAPQSMRYFLMPIRTAQPTLLTLCLWLMKSLRIPAFSGDVVSPLKHPTRCS